MIHWINLGGPLAWVQIILFFIILYLAIREFISLKKHGTPATPSGLGAPAVLFWGGVCMGLGFLAHYSGVYQSMQIISRARDISPGIVAKGYAAALVPVIVGLIVFICSGILWLILKRLSLRAGKKL